MTSQLQNKREFDKCFELILKITISKILSHGMGRVMANYTTARLVAEWWRGEWPSDLYSFRQVTEVKLGRVSSNSG